MALETGLQIFGFEFIAFFLALCVIGLAALVLVALWMYRDAQSRGIEPAIWLVVLILATVFVGILGVVVVLVAYLIVRGSHPVGGAMPYGYPPYAAVPYPTGAACPVCGRGMMWVPQSVRWYCTGCGQYR